LAKTRKRVGFPKVETGNNDTEVQALRALLEEKVVEMSRREADSRVRMSRLEKEVKNLVFENQVLKRQVAQMKSAVSFFFFVNWFVVMLSNVQKPSTMLNTPVKMKNPPPGKDKKPSILV
jgi:hypothetical protein